VRSGNLILVTRKLGSLFLLQLVSVSIPSGGSDTHPGRLASGILGLWPRSGLGLEPGTAARRGTLALIKRQRSEHSTVLLIERKYLET